MEKLKKKSEANACGPARVAAGHVQAQLQPLARGGPGRRAARAHGASSGSRLRGAPRPSPASQAPRGVEGWPGGTRARGSYLGSQGAEQGEQEAQGAPGPAARPWGPHRCAARRGHSGRLLRRRRRSSRWCCRRCCRRRCPSGRRVPALIYSADGSMHDWKTTPLFKSPFSRAAPFQKAKSPASFYYSDRFLEALPSSSTSRLSFLRSRSPSFIIMIMRSLLFPFRSAAWKGGGGGGREKRKKK